MKFPTSVGTTTIMEATKSDPPKMPDMIMCGDHSSFTKTELDFNMDDKEKERPKDKNIPSYAKISPTSSHTEGHAESAVRLSSEHGLRAAEARRRQRDLERSGERPDLGAQMFSRPLVQAFPLAAMGSCRWPPYLLAVWLLVLVLTHVLHCLVSVLGRALPALKKCTQYFRIWTEETWRERTDINQKVIPVGLAAVTGMLYGLYYAMYMIYGIVLWSVEPLYAADLDENRSSLDMEAKVTDYIEDESSKISSIKQ